MEQGSRPRWSALAALLAGGLFVASCTSGSPAAGPEPIRIGSLIGVSSVHADSFLAGAQAAVRGINARGGVHGRPLVLENCDDLNDPNRAQVCARGLVSHGVVATAGNITPFGMVEAPILDSAGIPEVGTIALSREESLLATCFPLDGGGAELVAGNIFGVKRRGLRSIFFTVFDTPPGHIQIQFARQVARTAKVDYLGEALVPQVATDFSPYIKAAMDSKADVVVIGLPPHPAIQFLAAAGAAGAKFLIAIPSGELVPRDIHSLAPSGRAMLENDIEFGAMPPQSATDRFPALKEFTADMDAQQRAGDPAAGPDGRSGGPMAAWLSVRIIAELAESLPEVTAAAMLDALRTRERVDTFGLMPPWTPGRNGPPAFPRVSNSFGYFVSTRGGVQMLAETNPFSPLQAAGLEPPSDVPRT